MYRAMAEETINVAERRLAGRVTQCRTRSFRLLGAEDKPDRLVEQLMEAYPISSALAEHLVRKFGSLAPRVLEPAKKEGDLLSPIAEGALPVQAEVLYCVRQEMATSIEDILARRLGLQLFDWNLALDAAPVVARILARELGWSQRRRRKRSALYGPNTAPSTEDRSCRDGRGANSDMSVSPRDISAPSTRERQARDSWCSIAPAAVCRSRKKNISSSIRNLDGWNTIRRRFWPEPVR